MKMSRHVKAVCATAAVATLVLAGCGKKEDDAETSAIASTITLSGTLKLGSTSLVDSPYQLASSTAPASGDIVFCVTFAEVPEAGKGTVGSDGKFSLTMPGGKPMGCFLNSSSGSTKATFIFADSGSSAMGSSTSSSVALGKDIDLGSISMSSDGKISIPYASISGATASELTGSSNLGIDLDQVHGNSYAMSCVTTGDAVSDARCKSDMSDSTVFFRVLKGSKGGVDVRGLGAWASKEAFTACGSIDMTDAEKAKIDGVTFTQGSTGSAYSSSSSCRLRGQETTRNKDNLQDYYMLSAIKPDGMGGFSAKTNGEHKISATCTLYDETSIVFTGSADAMYGAFIMGAFLSSGCSASDAQNNSAYQASFNVKFTKK